MIPAVLYAVPAFLLLIVMEAVSYRFLPDDGERGYEVRDTSTSLSMGLGSQIIGVPWKILVALAYAGLYVLTPLSSTRTARGPGSLLFFADDLAYYWFHRAAPRGPHASGPATSCTTPAGTSTCPRRCGRAGRR